MKHIYLSITLLFNLILIGQNNPPTVQSQPSLITLNSIPQAVDVNEFNLIINDIDGDNVTVLSSVNQYDCNNIALLQNSSRYGNGGVNTLGAGNVQTFKSINNGFITKLEVEFRGSTTSTTQSVIEVYQNNNADPSQATDVELIGTVTLDIPAEFNALGVGHFEKPIYVEQNRMYVFRKISGPGIRMRQGSFYTPGRTFNHNFDNPLVVNESGGFNNDWKFFITQFGTNGTSPTSIALTASDGIDDSNANVDVFHLSEITPTAITKNITVNLDANGNASITPQQIDNGSTAACGGNLNLSLDINNFDFNDLGDNVVTLFITDDSGNSASATAIVNVQDNLPPNITCPDNITTTATNPNVNFNNPTVTDNVTSTFPLVSPGMTYIGSNGGKNFFISDQSFNGANAFADALARGGFVATISDATQNAFIASALQDSGIPEAHIGYSDAATEGSFVWQDGSLSTYENWRPGEPNNTDGGEDYVTISAGGSWNDVGARGTGNARYILQLEQTDGFLIQTNGLASGSSFPIGVTTNTFEAYDASGNNSSCSFDITVTDIPVVSTQNITVELDSSGNATITAASIDNGSSSVSGISDLSLNLSTFDCSNLGENTVTLTVTSNSGDTASGTSVVTVVDNLSPSAATQDLTVELNANGEASITPAQVDNGSADNCGVDTLALDITSFDCSNLGENTVTLTVTDASGNEASATATVTVVDNLLPTALTQDLTVELDVNGEASITPAQVDNGSADNCGVDTLALDITSFDCSNLGENTVTLTVTDASGNEASATAVVTVVDVSGPVLITQDIKLILDEDDTVSILPEDVLNSVEDNCTASQDITLALDQDTFTAAGVYVVNLTATDALGNSTTVSAEVTVDSVLSIDDVDSNPVIKLYPNPTSSDLFFEVSNIEVEMISIYDMNGRLVKTSQALSLNVGNLASGVYFARLTGANGKTFKVLKFIRK